jgi:hypothetical protein
MPQAEREGFESRYAAWKGEPAAPDVVILPRIGTCLELAPDPAAYELEREDEHYRMFLRRGL